MLKSGYYDEPLSLGNVEYNVGMEKINNKEHTFIKVWSKDRTDRAYSDIRKYIGGEDMGDKIKKYAEILINMFKKYDSLYPKNKPIYRAIRFKKENDINIGVFKSIREYYLDIKNKGFSTLIDKSPSSFSKSLDVAKKFGSYNDKRYYTVLFILNNRKSNELDIEEMSNYPEQKEIIVQTHKAIYKVTNYTINDSNDVLELELEEVKQ